MVKRLFDVVCAAAGLVVLAPIVALAAVGIKLTDPGPVFYRARRVGYLGRQFTMFKLRTMRSGESDTVTRTGTWLRRTSLDELPQLFNVLRGDMSLVGPRPCIPYETEQFAPHHFERFLVPAGITGLWQVAARANSTFGEALDMDVSYARNWSLGLDLRLLCQTPLQVLRQRGAA